MNQKKNKKISISELKDYCAMHQTATINYSTKNQSWFSVSDPCKVNIVSASMLVYDNPNLVCIRFGGGTICFDRVKYAEIDYGSSALGTVITLFCGSTLPGNHDITYKLIAT